MLYMPKNVFLKNSDTIRLSAAVEKEGKGPNGHQLTLVWSSLLPSLPFFVFKVEMDAVGVR